MNPFDSAMVEGAAEPGQMMSERLLGAAGKANERMMSLDSMGPGWKGRFDLGPLLQSIGQLYSAPPGQQSTIY